MDTETALILPHPRQISRQPGEFDLNTDGFIHLASPKPASLWQIATMLREKIRLHSQHEWTIRAGVETGCIQLTIDNTALAKPEAYSLSIKPEGIKLVGSDSASVFYGCQTLCQLLRQFDSNLPCFEIEDWPDFSVRGYMLDISRDRVPKMETLFSLVDRLAEWKINHLQLYTEHTFAYTGYEIVWQHASPMIGEEILALDAYCRDRYIDLVPNQASFGHMDRWLKHTPFKHLAESPNGWEFRGTQFSNPFTLNPLHPGSLELISGLYQDLLPHFSSQLFNVNADESFDLGQGASQQAVMERGKAAVYFEYLHKLNELVQSQGRRMLYWGDFYWEHPQSKSMHPSDATVLEWGYEAGHDFAAHTSRLAEAEIPFYVCPGTSAWNSFLGRTENMLANITNAAENGLQYGAIGLLNTGWGDNGSLEYLPVSYLGIAFGAACSWCLESALEFPLTDALSYHAFSDPAGEAGQIIYDLGNAYLLSKPLVGNSVAPFWSLIESMMVGWRSAEVDVESFKKSMDYVNDLSARWNQVSLNRPNSALIQDEIANNIAMWRHACRCGIAFEQAPDGDPVWRKLTDELQAITSEHQRLWLARNRPGGLEDSAAQLSCRLIDYQHKW